MAREKLKLIELLSPTENRINAVETGNINYFTLGFVESAVRGAIWGGALGSLVGGIASLVEEQNYNPGYTMIGSTCGLVLDEVINITRTLCLALVRKVGAEGYREHLKKFYNREPKYPELLKE